MTSAVSHWRSRRPPHQGWKPCSSVTPGSPSSRPEAHPRVLLFLLFCFHCCRCGVSPPTSLCPPGFLPQPRLPVQFLQRALAVLSSRKQPFSFCLSPAQQLSGRPSAKESKAEPLSLVFRLCSSWGIWENRYTEESRGAFLMHPSSLRFPPLSLARQEAKPLGGLGRGLADGDHSWIPAVGALSATRTDLPDLPLLPWGPTEAGPHSFHWGGLPEAL